MDSNHRATDYESAALTPELPALERNLARPLPPESEYDAYLEGEVQRGAGLSVAEFVLAYEAGQLDDADPAAEERGRVVRNPVRRQRASAHQALDRLVRRRPLRGRSTYFGAVWAARRGVRRSLPWRRRRRPCRAVLGRASRR